MILTQPHRLRQFVQQLHRDLLPGSCLLCGMNAADSVICPGCTDDLPVMPQARCPQCGEPTTHGERCGACLKHAPHFDAALALMPYEFPADRLIQALKYGHHLALAAWLGQRLAQLVKTMEFDQIVPMPLHPQRLRERGFNQAVELARPIARTLKRPLLLDALERTRATPPQAELPLRERHRNVRGAFECRTDFAGRRLLLVDDVMTSGATLDECARILGLHGASQVFVAVAARAFKH